jgi:NADPH:quinone reductase-like Zn-dependent oxidoreductase
MRAAYIREFGGLEKIQTGDLPAPETGAGEVLVRVKAAALNHLDIWVRRGRLGASPEGPLVLGSDAAGVVERLGDGVPGVRAGDEVVVNPGVACLRCEYCRRGAHSECPELKLLGFQRPGTYAEFVVVPAANVGTKPAHLTWEEAAALPLAHLTAWHMLFARAGLQAGETVLIHGIGGGVALAALQWVLLSGGAAYVTSSSDEKLARAKALGAAEGINYKVQPDVAAEVRRLTAGRGVDVVFDTAGAATLPVSLAAVRRGGRIVTCGVTSGAEAKLNLQALYWNHISLLGSTLGSQEDFRRLLRAVSNARLQPVVDQVFPLARYAEAARRMEEGGQFGKLVLTV